MARLLRTLLSLLIAFIVLPAFAAPGVIAPAAVAPAVARLQAWYNPATGLWNATGWWNSANALTALIDYARVTRSRQYDSVIARTWQLNRHAGFLNDYYDDEGWWALAWIDAYDLTHRPEYLATAESIFANMTGGWDNTCRGGLWWSKKRTYKNAIPNELFLSVAAHLAARAQTPEARASYLHWALREWSWFRHSGMIESNHLVSDGLTTACRDNHKTEWTYNQGVILGGLTQLARIRHRGGFLRPATRIANAAVVRLASPDGILHEPCEPRCGADGTQFKGIFVRNLAELDQLHPRSAYRRFILTNAQSILSSDQTSTHELGSVWSGPPRNPGASSQSSGLDALNAALQLETRDTMAESR